MASRRASRATLASSDDETVSLTSTVPSPDRETYVLEAILSEIDDDDGITYYLVKWEGYSDLECTWEVEENFQDEQTLLDWKDQKMRISRGLEKPFNLDEWQKRMDEEKAATKARKALRRKKKIELGMPVADKAPSSDDSSDDEYSESTDETHSPEREPRSPSPIWTAKEESTLLQGLNRFKFPDWKMLLSVYGLGGTTNEDLKGRSEASLQRKADALRKDFEGSGKEFPVPKSLNTKCIKDSEAGNRGKEDTCQRALQKPGSGKADSVKRVEFANNVHEKQPQDSSQVSLNHNRKGERLKINIPTRTVNSSEPKSAPTMSKGPTNAKFTVDSSSSSTHPLRRLNSSSATTDRRAPQLGIVGRGPARKGIPVAKPLVTQPVNVLKNWGAGPEKKRKSRYEMMTPENAQTKTGGTFKKFSTRRRFELAGRFERTPDAGNLTFVNLKDGKVLPMGPASIVPKPVQKTPFQLLQERLNEDEASTPATSESPARPSLQHAATTSADTSSFSLPSPEKSHAKVPDVVSAAAEATLADTSSFTLPSSEKPHAKISDVVGTAVEANSPPQSARRASVPSKPMRQQVQRRESILTAPVAIMSPGVNKDHNINSSEHLASPHLEVSSPQQVTDVINDSANLHKQASEGHGIQDANIGIPGTNASAPSRPPSRNILRCGEQRESEQVHYGVSKPVPSQTMSMDPQRKPDGYTLFPLDTMPRTSNPDTVLRPTDVIAQILTGSEGNSAGRVIFRGLQDRDLKRLFLTMQVPPKQMHVRCETMCTAGEFAITFHDPDSYLGSGWVVPFWQSVSNIDKVSAVLAEHASGALFFAENFTLLLYPASCISWEFLDRGFSSNSPPPEAKLRFAMLSPWPHFRQSLHVDHGSAPELSGEADLRLAPINAVLQRHFGMDFRKLVAQPMDKDGSKAKQTKAFFLIFPPSAQDEFDIVVDWLQTNGPLNIYNYSDQGTWEYFQQNIEKGVIICHASFVDYWVIPYLAWTLRKSINIFNFSLKPMSPLAPDPHLIRLFPTGTAILLTDSLFLIRPIEAARILSWFRHFALPGKARGTWKVCTRPAIREWLLRVQESLRYPYGKDFVTCYREVAHLLPIELTKEWDRDVPKDEAPIACMGTGVSNFDESLGTGVLSLAEIDNQVITQNDNTLCSWFAGWAMTKQEKFRRLHVVTGRDGEGEHFKQLKEKTKQYNHIEVMAFEKFAKAHEVWDWPKLKTQEEKRRAEAMDKEKAAAAQEKERTRRGSAAAAADGDVEMTDIQHAEEQSLFLPMDISPS